MIRTGTTTPHFLPRDKPLGWLLPALLLAILLGFAPTRVRAAGVPVRLGINIAGSWHMLHTDKLFYQYDAWFRAVNDLGAQFIDVNFLVKHALVPQSWTEAKVVAQLKEIDRALTAHGLQYLISIELANWSPSLELAPGINMLDHPDGTHRWDLPSSWLDQILPPLRAGLPGIQGINFDEGEHNQLWCNQGVFVTPSMTYDKPYYLVTDGMSMKEAFDGLVARAQWLRTGHYQGRLRMVSELVWPDMFHIFARAGWTVAPKILEENFAPVMLSAALGAALQYQDRGTDFWVVNEISRATMFPGWPPSALRSALLMSYWLGASTIYVENMDYSDSQFKNPHPLASPKGALVWWDDPDHYGITNHGKVVQDFYKNYVPSHPRAIDWRDYRPRVAIVRLPDGCTARPTFMPRDRLLGNRNHPSDDISTEWLKVWSVLTHGVVKPQAISMAHLNIYPDCETRPFFVPIDSVAVFDHTVRGAVLDSVKCFVVCGYELSAETFAELKWRAQYKGATVIIARRLYSRHATGSLPGDWLLVDDFNSPEVGRKISPYLGSADVARFRFKNYWVEFLPTTDGDTLKVNVRAIKNAADPALLGLE